MLLRDRITTDLTLAMKAKDAAKLSTLRMIKASVMNKEIEKQGALTDDEMIKALHSLVKQRRDSIEQYEKAGRQDLADKETGEVAVIEAYLPHPASNDEIEQAVGEAIIETGASSMRDMGSVMKAAGTKLAGKSVDNRTMSEIVKSRLSGM